jgi:hypothetical protein
MLLIAGGLIERIIAVCISPFISLKRISRSYGAVSYVHKKGNIMTHESFKCLESWGQSVVKKDKPAVLGHYVNGGSTLWPTLSNNLRTDEPMIGDYFDLFLPKLNGVDAVEWNQNEFQKISDTHGVWSGVYTFHLTAGATKARYTYVVAKVGDAWQIVHHHSSLMPEN